MKDSSVIDRSDEPERPSTPEIEGARAEDGAEDVVAVAISYEDYEEIELRRKQVHARILWTCVILATICIPLAYLQLTGQFSTAGLISQKLAARRPHPSGALKVYDPAAEPKRTPEEQRRFDHLKSDLNDYINRGLKSISPEEKIAIIAFSNVTGSRFKNQATTLATLRADVIPAQEKLVAEATALRPATKEVSALHVLLLRSVKMRLVAYRQMLSSENDPDGLWKYAFDAEFKDAEDNAQSFHTQLASLSSETGVTLPR